jgi:hypothetical protein
MLVNANRIREISSLGGGEYEPGLEVIPEAAYAESVAALVVKRGGDPSTALIALKATAALATMVGDELEQHCEMRPAVEMSYQCTRDGRNGQGRWFPDHQSTVASAGKLATGQLSDSCSGMRCGA